MKKRDSILTIIFLLIIFGFPLVSLGRDALNLAVPEDTSAQQAVLEGNGTLANKDEAEQEEQDNGVTEGEEEFSAMVRFRNSLSNFSSHLIGTPYFIDANSELTYALSGGTYIESNSVILGDNNFLFYKATTDGDPVSDYKGTNLFDDEELVAIGNNLLNIRNELSSRGIDFYVLAIPNKSQVYDRYMPVTIYRDSEYSRGMQLRDFITANSDIEYIYPINELKELSQNQQAYYFADTHETEIGAFTVYGQFCERRYGFSQPQSEAAYRIALEGYTGDLGLISNVKTLEKLDTIVAFYQTDEESYRKHERLLFIGDSFTGYLSNIAYYDFDAVKRVGADEFTMSLLDEFNPDVVIFESAERRIEVLGQNLLIQ